ncbi:hypothetical protein F4679DRAFT_585529 [Xylaria curta]|nr:hypothetical protein F4679DRAFT_585529 [Xylaria curta]
MVQDKDYSLLSSSESNEVRLRSILYLVVIPSSWFITMASGILFGASINNRSLLKLFQAVGNLNYYMHFTGSFAQSSDTNSDALWDSLFPENLGFIKHPEIAPALADVTVFYELH